MLFLELKLDTEEGTDNETTHLLIFIKFIKEKVKRNQWNCSWEKMSKAIEENK